MLKRSLLVLALTGVGAALGVIGTGVVTSLQSRAAQMASAVAAPPTPAPPVVAPPDEPVAPSSLRSPSGDPGPSGTAKEGQAAPPPAGGTNGALKVGLVNLKDCFGEANYELAKEVTAKLKDLENQLEKGLKELANQAAVLREQISGALPRSQLQQDKQRQLKLVEMQLKLDQELGRAKFLNEYSRLKLEVYTEIRRVIDIYGREHKFDLILRVEEAQLEEDSPTTVSQQINQRVVLYHGAALDVTKDVLALLNAEHKKKPKPVDPPAAGPDCTSPDCKGKVANGRCTKCGKAECAKCKLLSTDVKCPKCGGELPKK